MAKLVRAKPKAREYMPEWAKCCPEYIAANQAIGEITVDLDDCEVWDRIYCSFCGREATWIKGVQIVGDEDTLPLAVLDLDEGEYPRRPA